MRLRDYAWRRAGKGEAVEFVAVLNGQVRPSPLDSNTVQLWSAPLPFYADTELVRIVDQSRGAPNARLALSAGGQAVLLDHSNVPIYRHNARVGMRISAANAAAYAAFFFDHVGGAHGRFLIVESARELAWQPDADPAAIASAALEIRPVTLRGVEKDAFLLSATVVFKTGLFHGEIRVAPDGRVDMLSEAVLVDRLPVRPDCTKATDPFHAASEGQLY
ncbi:hypothetical protein [Sphingomonas sp. KR3-1]|uniref:hypothetical protein n=1 Tax=Sphingomonas sp. KR3-1 TaxID=3156611 RepID=UPI0032B413CB